MMMLFNTLNLAIRSTLANKMRSFLTMLGIIIGVLSVVLLVSIVQSTTSSITSAISSMGSELITATVTDEDISVSAEDYQALEEYEAIAGVAPYITLSVTARSGANYTSVSGYGVTEDYLRVADLALQAGRGIVKSDLDWRTGVCVIGTEVAGELFESYDVIGESITMSNRTFTIVGLLEESGSSLSGSLDNCVLIPLSTAQRLSDTTSVST
ncbi:MAG: ABC transporter permease, partial [Clostridia bacterium]|nr:ABC transporter permease [Clostridia bacterium]